MAFIVGPEGSHLAATSLSGGGYTVMYEGQSIGSIKKKRDGSWTLNPSKYCSLNTGTQTALLEAMGRIVDMRKAGA